MCKIPNISEQHLCGYNNVKANINLSKMKLKCTGKLERFKGWRGRWIEEDERKQNPIFHSEKAKTKNLAREKKARSGMHKIHVDVHKTQNMCKWTVYASRSTEG